VAVALAGFTLTPMLSVVRLLGPLLMLAGFLAVATEAGRPWRGLNLLRMVHRSWMSRELWAGLGFLLMASADLVWPAAIFRLLAVLAALLLIVSQGFMLYRARGVALWTIPLMPALFLTAGLLTGTGLLGLFHAALEVSADNADLLVWTSLGLIVLNGACWASLLDWRAVPACRDAVAGLKSESVLTRTLGMGHLLPLVLLVVFGAAALPLAGVIVLMAGGFLKALLILQAGQFRPIAIFVKVNGYGLIEFMR